MGRNQFINRDGFRGRNVRLKSLNSLETETEKLRLIKTYPAEGLRREPYYEYLTLEPVPPDVAGR